jgi:uncharacterized protein YkwD
MRTIVLGIFISLLFGFSSVKKLENNTVCLSKEEDKLYRIITAYRKTKNLKAIPLSAKLSQVAQTHARDLMSNYTFDADNKCNPHSWSSKGPWSACCYTSDHKEAKCMWDKPREIASYPGNGYEIAYFSSAGANADEALAGWKLSAGHNPLIVNEGMWSKVKWQGIGIGIFGEYGVVWFGEEADDSPLTICK